MPKVKASDGVIGIRYPRRLLALPGSKRAAEIALNSTIPWIIAIQGAGMEIDAKLGGLQLAGLEVKGDAGTTRLELPVPAGRVPITVSGGAAEMVVQRPAGVAVRVHFKGWSSEFVFDEQVFHSEIGVESPGYEVAESRYEIDVSGSASAVRVISV